MNVVRIGASIVVLIGALIPSAAHAQLTGQDAALALQSTLVEAIAAAEDSVVAIAREPKGGRIGVFGASPEPSPDHIPDGYGSGVVVDAEGLILTNYHVLGDVEKYDYYVWLNHRVYKAEVEDAKELAPKRLRAERVEAADPWMDLAILKIDAKDLKPIKFGDAGALKKGHIVIALGNPHALARDGEVSATWGIVSNLNRAAPGPPGVEPPAGRETLHQYGNLIQTDARLPVGSSGGALINLRGEMVGMTSSLAALSNGEANAGFAIPVDDAFVRVVETLKLGRRADFGFLGVTPQHAGVKGEGPLGASVAVVMGTPAAQAGMRTGDVVTHLDGRRVYDANDLFREVSRVPPGTRVEMRVIRDRRTLPAMVVELSKKYLETTRRPVARVEDPKWRGLQVDYVTAIPGQTLPLRLSDIPASGCVAVVNVEEDSPAWKAGLRRWTFISHVGDTAVDTPDEFHRAVAGQGGDVELRLYTSRASERRNVSAP
jgi:serine protease Do